MIQIYKPGNENYDRNGDAVLHPESCTLEAEINGAWELTLENPSDGNMELIQKEAVISCTTFLGENQRFRIYKREKSDDGVTAYAYPIFFDVSHKLLLDTRPTNKTGQEALDVILSGTGFAAQSDVLTVETAYYERTNILSAISGDDENSFVNRWGGEAVYKNKLLIMNKSAGSDKGVRAEFGHNLNSISEEEDMTDVITRIIPVAYNGYMLSGSTPWVDSPNINKYQIIYEKEVKFDDVKLTEDAQEDEDSFETLTTLRAELVRRCNLMFADGCDVPTISYTVDMVDLSQTEEYKQYTQLEKVSIGDTVYCKNKNIAIDVKAKAIKIKYDCISKKNEEITLGNYAYDYFASITGTVSRVSSITGDDGNVKAERVSGIIDGMQAQLKVQRTIAEKQNVRAILFEDTDTTSTTYGAMALGTQGFEISNERLADNSDWNWKTFGTSQGFYADLIIAGILYSQNYVSGSQGLKIDLNHGTISAKNFSIDASGNVSFAGTVKSSSAEITGGTIQITTAAESTSAISLNYNGWTNSMTPQTSIVKKNSVYAGSIAATSLSSGSVITSVETGTYSGYSYTAKAKIDSSGNLSCTGTKSRIAETENYNKRLLYCYEMPSPIFGDIGSGKIQDDGDCYIYLDTVFSETIDTSCEYHVFLQNYGEGNLKIKEKNKYYFVVSGEAETEFAWEIKAKQLGFDGIRLESMENMAVESAIDYAEEANTYLENYEKEMLNYEESN